MSISSAATWHVLLVFIAYTYCLFEHELNLVKYWLSALGWLFYFRQDVTVSCFCKRR